ncbi:MAG: EAL domain-containing protein [Hyphomicrobium sp.]|nr:EAL domain-containing protein [Hyphomicrobium sp.]
MLISMALVTSALAIGLHLHLGYSLELAILVGLALFVGLSGFQAFWMSSADQEVLAAEVARLEHELGRGGAPAPAPSLARPAANRGTPPVPPLERLDRTAQLDPPPSNGEPSSINEDDVEMLQQRIKAMLLEVSAAEQAREVEETSAGAGTAVAAAPVSLPPVAAGGVEVSLAALRSAASTMRDADDRSMARPAPRLAAAPPRVADPVEVAAAEKRRSVREAVEAGRVDVFLEPIMGLNDLAARHYEVSIRLRGAAGEDLGSGENTVELAGRGLLPLFDRVRLEHTAGVAERLADRGKAGAVFSQSSGEALSDDDYRTVATETVPATGDIARKLVLTFTQADVRTFRAAEQRAVATLAGLGFRFGVTDLTDLDMNFEAMATAGFAFARLDASVFVEGLPIPGGTIPAADVCRHLAGLGYAVVVGNITDEAMLARIFGFGVVLGQGTLFGGRRPVKPGISQRTGQAAA